MKLWGVRGPGAGASRVGPASSRASFPLVLLHTQPSHLCLWGGWGQQPTPELAPR